MAVLIFLFAFQLPLVASAETKNTVDPLLQFKLAKLTNEYRVKKDLQPLKINPLLTVAAQMKAENMAKRGYFAHTSPSGVTPWYWFFLAGYRYEYAGENLAMNFFKPEDIQKAWLTSPTHKANLTGNHYTDIGTGYAWGTYQGKKVLFVAQLYANPVSVSRL
jgi:uncharacterized protein YkwD